MLTMRTRQWSCGARAAGSTLVAMCLAACSGTMAFSDSSSLVVVGDPPAPPPAPKVEAPAPKRVEVTLDKIVINEKIQFDYNKATIKPESHGLLDEIVSVVKENPHIKKISIEGHTDADGTYNYNLKLSDDRSQAVMKYLTDHGIEATRLTAKGLGESKPIASNDTDEGKEKNRRVEFMITEQEEVTATYEVDPKTGKRKEVAAASADSQDGSAKAKQAKKEKAK
jgi:outer membrane protein OmpA-like peptidoglycan-associated protein